MTNEGWVTVMTAIIGTVGIIAAGILGYQSGSKAVDKDYVQIAISTLGRKDASPELRRWSVDVLSELSPVPFGKKLQQELSAGGLVTTRLLVQRVNIPKVMNYACPDLLKGAGRKLSNELALRVVREYDKCRVTLDATHELIDGLNKLADEHNASQKALDAELAYGVSTAK